MKIIRWLLYSLIIILFSLSMLFFAKAVKANTDNNFESTNLRIEYTNQTKPSAEPKSLYVKYAGVYFISKTRTATSDANADDINPIKNSNCLSGEVLVDGICMSTADCQDDYPLTSVSSQIGSYISADCSGNGNLRYCYTRCNNGWTKSGCSCNENTCDGYPLSTSTLCSESYACKKGSSYMYQCMACPEGYGLENGICIEIKRPDNCPYDEKPSDSKGMVASHKYGSNVCYYYTSCYEGYSGPAGGDCTAKSCDRTVYPYEVQPSSNAGVVASCKSGENTYWGYTSCNTGWTLSGAICNENACTGYGSGTATIGYCSSSESCQKGSTKVYRCKSNSCQSGYGVNSNGLCEVISCPTGQINIYTHWCSDAWRCLMPGG